VCGHDDVEDQVGSSLWWEHRRQLIIGLKKPRFTKHVPVHIERLDVYCGLNVIFTEMLASADLNAEQRAAISRVFSADVCGQTLVLPDKLEDFSLILGMPGTGKTTAIARLVQMMVAAGKTVLITSYTHSAVDNILKKLMVSRLNLCITHSQEFELPFVRLGRKESIHPSIQPFCAETRIAGMNTVQEVVLPLLSVF
jgi:DNA replication ATP-dependent helicase Dna2